MRVRVLYFGVLKERLGRDSEWVELADRALVADLMARYGQEDAAWMGTIAVAVNRQYARREDELREGDEVALLPPVSGGSRDAGSEFCRECGREAGLSTSAAVGMTVWDGVR